MNYCHLDEQTKCVIVDLIDFLFNRVIEDGGDGDAIWYCRYYNVLDIKEWVEKYNKELKWPWEVRLEGQTLHWGTGQEWILITNDKAVWESAPNWYTVKIMY